MKVRTPIAAVVRVAVAAVVAVMAVAALAGCAGRQHHSAHLVTGMLIRVGGPALGGPVPLPGTVMAQDAAGRRYTVRVGRDGRFRLMLPTGRYRLTGRSPRINSGRQLCKAAARVVVGSEVTAEVRGIKVVCSIR